MDRNATAWYCRTDQRNVHGELDSEYIMQSTMGITVVVNHTKEHRRRRIMRNRRL